MARIDNRRDLQIVHLPLDELIPYARNARTHSDAQVAQIAGSMREFGWTNPVLIDEDHSIIAGHGRVLAARKLKLTDDIPCIVLAGMSDAQRRALVIADNKIALNASFDIDMLVEELGDISSDGFDLNMIGFNEAEMAALLGGVGPNTGGEDGEDETSSPPVIPVTVEGDVWILGRHRLLCGDSTNPQHVERVMGGELADFCFTSPPYGQQRQYKTGIEDWDALMQGVFSILPVSDSAQVLVNLGLFHRDSEWVSYWDNWISFMKDAGWRKFGWYVWDQGWGMQGDWQGRLAPSHEFIFHFNREAVKPNRVIPKKPENIKDKTGIKNYRRGDGSNGLNSVNASPKSALHTHKIPDSVIRVARHTGGLGDSGAHPAVFPVDLVSEMLTTFTNPDAVVFEPFNGSGTQIISCQKNGRNCRAIEIAPAYVDVAVRRWQKFTNQQATLEGDGRTFAEVDEARQDKSSS